MVQSGDRLTSTIFFESGRGVVFTRTATVALLSTALAGSHKSVDKPLAQSGDLLTYTIHLQGDSYISSTLSLADILPTPLRYVPDSLRYDSGVGGYVESTGTIWWKGNTERTGNTFFNLGNSYVWGDSDGQGRAGEVPYNWIEIKNTGATIAGGDNNYYCNFPIGFDFPYYSQTQRTFCVSTNGFVAFDPLGDAGDLYHHCPMPNSRGTGALIAAIWSDLVVTDAIHYQSFGVAPQRYLVVQWEGVRRYGTLGGRLASFQLVLFENGLIRVAIKEAGELRGHTSTTGIENETETEGVTYACNKPGTLHDQLAIVFVPPGGTIGSAQAQIQFQAVVDAKIAEDLTEPGNSSHAVIGVNVGVTNTVLITGSTGVITRQVATLVNPLDLSESTFRIVPSELIPGVVANFTLVINSRGLVSTTNGAATVALPAALTYEQNTIRCTEGNCRAEENSLLWNGNIAPGKTPTIQFGAQLREGLPDRTPVEVIASLADGFGAIYPLTATVLARRSDLSPSQIQLLPRFVEPGSEVNVLARIQNIGGLATNAAAHIVVPSPLAVMADTVVCGTGNCRYEAGAIQWQGRVGSRELVPIRFTVRLPPATPYGASFSISLTVDDIDWQDQYTQEAVLMAMHNYWLPIITGADARHQLYLPLIASWKQ